MSKLYRVYSWMNSWWLDGMLFEDFEVVWTFEGIRNPPIIPYDDAIDITYDEKRPLWYDKYRLVTAIQSVAEAFTKDEADRAS